MTWSEFHASFNSSHSQRDERKKMYGKGEDQDSEKEERKEKKIKYEFYIRDGERIGVAR